MTSCILTHFKCNDASCIGGHVIHCTINDLKLIELKKNNFFSLFLFYLIKHFFFLEDYTLIMLMFIH